MFDESSLEQWAQLGTLAPYLVILGVLLACSLGLPLPEDIPLLTAGFLCYRGLASIYVMIPIAMAGVLGGDFLLYSMGARFGHQIVEHRFVRRLVNAPRLLAAERLFQRHGIKIVFIGRFLPGLRPMIFVAAGVLGVRFITFAAVNGFAACISVPTLVLLGRYFGHNLDRIQEDVRTASHLIILLVGVSAFIAAAVYFHRRQKGMMQEAGVDDNVPPQALPHLPPGGEEPLEPEDRSAAAPVDAERPD